MIFISHFNGWDQRYLKDAELPDNSPAKLTVSKELVVGK